MARCNNRLKLRSKSPVLPVVVFSMFLFSLLLDFLTVYKPQRKEEESFVLPPPFCSDICASEHGTNSTNRKKSLLGSFPSSLALQGSEYHICITPDAYRSETEPNT